MAINQVERRMAVGFSKLAEKIEIRASGDVSSEEDRLKKNLLVFSSTLMSFGVMLWLAIYWVMGLKFPTTAPLMYQLVSLASLVLYLRTRNFERFRFIQLTLFLFGPFVMQWSIGSYVTASGLVLWALLAPIGAMVFHGWRQSLPWFAAYLVFNVASGFFDYYLGQGSAGGIPMETIAVFFGLNFIAISTIIYLLIRYFLQEQEKIKMMLAEDKKRLAEEDVKLRMERAKSERLLLNVLPAPIARRLKDDQSSIADGHADVSVMFADLVNFTRLTEQMSPQEMVDLLNRVFSNFDWLMEKYNVEKIKTVGDAYMVAGGLINPNQDHVAAMADTALEMRSLMDQHPLLRQHHFGIHIGIATGPVVAGVIGTKRFIYDLWGDTVNVASRLSAEGSAGQILIDKTTAHRLQSRYEIDGPHILSIKGKGDLTTYQLLGPKNTDVSHLVA